MAVCIAVVGAGVVGLSTAVQIQQQVPGAVVTLIADKFDKETTSDGAGGIFRPTPSKTPGVHMDLVRKWLRDTWDHYDRLAFSEEASEAGVQVFTGYQLYNKNQPNALESEYVYQYRPLTDKELNMFPGQRYRRGYGVTTLIAECSRYLPYLMRRFQKAGGLVVRKKIENLAELAGRYDLVVNCTGLGSKELLNDDKLVPIRGHLLRVKAPWIKMFVVAGDQGNIYIYPGIDNVTVGGSRGVGRDDLEPRKEERDEIWANACEIMPSLRKAEILWDWVGLRPHRDPLRVEKDMVVGPSGTLQVVHNYGHGAEGVSLSWGTAKHAVRLVQEVLQEHSMQKIKAKV